jgi:hypothetical protein
MDRTSQLQQLGWWPVWTMPAEDAPPLSLVAAQAFIVQVGGTAVHVPELPGWPVTIGYLPAGDGHLTIFSDGSACYWPPDSEFVLAHSFAPGVLFPRVVAPPGGLLPPPPVEPSIPAAPRQPADDADRVARQMRGAYDPAINTRAGDT